MTREEAIKIIDCYDIGFYDLSGEKIPADKLVDAFDMAIDALLDKPQCERVEVVRCKDCKYWSGEGEWNEPECTKWDLSYGGRISVDDNDYCSYGERKENETD